MTTRGRNRKPNLFSTIGTVFFGTGVITWAWTGHWQWLVVGAALLIMLAGIGAYLDGRTV